MISDFVLDYLSVFFVTRRTEACIVSENIFRMPQMLVMRVGGLVRNSETPPPPPPW